MILTVDDIIRFFDDGLANGATHMIILTDEHGRSEHPIYAHNAISFLMQRGQCSRDKPGVRAEVYYLDKPRGAQIYRSQLVQDMIKRWRTR